MSSNTNEQQQQLQENFLQQQEKISALKELVRKSEAAHGSSKTAAQEKVKTIAERLYKSKAKSRQGLNVSTYSTEPLSTNVSFTEQEQTNLFPVSQGQFHLQSPTASFTSTPNPTPTKPEILLRKNETSSTSIPSTLRSSDKIALMRQQLEENKLRMAQKASSKQHLEQLVSQLKDKFETTQQCLEDTTELGRSMSDLSNLIHYTPSTRERHKSTTDLSSQTFSLEKERIKFLENRCRLLEKQLEKEKKNNQSNNIANNMPPTSANNEVLEAKINELERSLKEKEQEFEAKEKSLMEKFQNSREITDYEASEETAKLMKENENLRLEIENLSKTNYSDDLVNQIDCLSQENTRLKQQLEILNKQLEAVASENANESEATDNKEKIENLKQQLEAFSSKETVECLDILNENQLLKQETETQLKRIQELNEITDVLETTRCDMTSKCTELEEQIKQLQADLNATQAKLSLAEEKCLRLEDVQASTADLTSAARVAGDTDSQIKAEMAKQIQELMDEITEVRLENSKLKASLIEQEKLEINDRSIAEKLASLEACIEAQREDLQKSQELQKKYEEELMEKTIEFNVLNANFKVLEEKLETSTKSKPLFSSNTLTGQDSNSAELEQENQQLKQKLDESNKAMIKLKLKCKQTEKQIEKLKKGSDLHEEVVKLTKEREQLQQKVTELEDEIGQWQLKQMESSQSSGKSEEIIQENLHRECEEKIHSLEIVLKEKETQMESLKQGEQSRVTSELTEIQMEEQVKELNEQLANLRKDFELKDQLLKESLETNEKLSKQKDELEKKVEHYLNENVELLDKVEKLSKSSSSAESIEIVERLTQQEKQELEEFNKRLGDSSEETSSQKEAVSELTQTEISPEITESLNKLREESSELMNKIELFTTERREVLEKMEHLTNENHHLLQRIEDLMQEKKELETKLNKEEESCEEMKTKLISLTKEKESLSLQLQNVPLSQGLTSMQQSSEVVAALDNSETLFDKCEKSLSKLYGELEAYRKAHDKKSKFNVSKKLAKEAENAHSQLSELLQKVKEASNAVETVTVVETVVAVTAPNGKALAEYEQLTAQNRELKATVQELRRLLDEARDQQDDQTDNRFSSEERQAIETEEAYEVQSENVKKLRETLNQIEQYETQLTELQSRVEHLTQELSEARTGLEEKTTEISELTTELEQLRKLSENFDRVINDKEMSHEKQIEQLTRLRKQLENKCETYEEEMEILETLVKEQKQQLIESYKEHEHEKNMSLLEMEKYEEKIKELKVEIAELKRTTALHAAEQTEDLQNEYEKLKESLKINKYLVQEQVEELAKKQESIDTLNQQIIDLYRTMEDNADKIIEKEDEISYLQELLETNKQELVNLEQTHKELLNANKELSLNNEQQKKQINEQIEQLAALPTWQQKVKELEQRNKEQLEKLKKYAANLKKKAQQCLDYENKLKLLETQTENLSSNNQELDILNDKNLQLQEELQKAQQTLQQKAEELQTIIRTKISLEEQVKQLQQELELKQQQNFLELKNLKDELLLTREQLKEKVQENEELKRSLGEMRQTIDEELQRQQKLEEELQFTQSQVVLLQNDLSAGSLKQELQVAQNTIVQLREELQASQTKQPEAFSSAFSSDWGDLNETEQLKQELQCSQENLKLKIKEIEELRQTLMAAQEQLTDWGNSESSSVKNADYENLNRVLQDKTAKLDRAEKALEELENELMTQREREHENSQKIQELTKEVESLKAGTSNCQTHETLENKLKEVTEELKAKSLKFEKSKAVIKERNGQIQRLQAQLKDLQEKLTACPEEEIMSPTTQRQLDASIQQPVREKLEALQQAYNKLNEKYNNEKCNFQETINRLETLHDGIQAKLQEDMAYIETLEQENGTFKDKICRLQECVAVFEDRRASMERKVNIMDEQMQNKVEEHLKNEDELIYRLNMLSEHDEIIAQRLLDSQSEKEILEENHRKLKTEYNLLQSKYQKLEKEFSEYKIDTSNDFEQELSSLREQLIKKEAEMERQKVVYDGMLAAKATELGDLECELSEQLDKMNAEKRLLSEQLERMTDDCSAHQNDVLRLQESLYTLEQAKTELERESSWLRMQSENSQQDLYELQELRMQSIQDKTEIENLRHQIETLSCNHETELQALRTQIAELDTLRMQVGQNQTDDQVFIETENKRLTDLLAEKEAIIENYQRQNLQLQMAAAAATSNNSAQQQDPFALAFGLHSAQNTDNNSQEIERLNQELQDKNNQIYRLQHDLMNLQTEINIVSDGNQEMQTQLTEHQQDVVNLQTLQNVATALIQSQSTDVIPAPPMFFTSESSVRSPFDDLIQPHTTAELSRESRTEQNPTIEDLQRNVSDLEKHAQDLEHKLAARNQRESENEEKLRELEVRYQERDHQLQQSQIELQRLQTELAVFQQQQTELVQLQQQLQQLRYQVEYLENLLKEKDQEIERLKCEKQNEEHLKKTMPSLESQILPAFQDPSVQPTLDMFFGNSSAPEFEVFSLTQPSSEPVVEEIIVPKKTYDCHPEEKLANAPRSTQESTMTALNLEEDWGDSWGDSEATAEAEHFAKLTATTTANKPISLVPREQQLELQLQDLNERLQELTLALERSQEQKKELHVKSGKLMKKLKEYKVKIEELQLTSSMNNNNRDNRQSTSTESSSMFDNLDAAIQDELKTQIKSLEDKLEEQKKQQENFLLEKEKLLKRIDVLTAGNERMSEMKERQDIEVQMYQARIKELQEKLANLDDWGNNDEAVTQLKEVPRSETVENKLQDIKESFVEGLQKQINNLNLEVQDLTGDRLELQALLEEEKTNLSKAEQTVASLRLQVQSMEEAKITKQSDETYQLNNLRLDLQNLQESYNTVVSNKEKLEMELIELNKTLSLSQNNEMRLQAEVDNLQSEVENLRDTLNNTKQSLIDLEAELNQLKEQKVKQIDEVSSKEKKQSIDLMKHEIELLETQKLTIEQEATQLAKENDDLKAKQKDQEDKLQTMTSEIEYLKSFNSSGSSSEELAGLLQEKESEILHLKQRINDLMNEDQTEKLVLEILTKNQEIHMLKMQVKHLEEDKQELENNLSLQITKEMQANKEETIQTNKQDNLRVQEFENRVKELIAEKKQMEEELQELNNVLESLQLEDKLKALTLEMDTKNIEILELRKTQETIKKSGDAVDFVALNSQWEAIVEQRCGEIAKMWQEHLATREHEFKVNEERLKEEIAALKQNQMQANVTIETAPQIISVETTSASTTVSESTSIPSGNSSADTSQDGTPLRRPQTVDNDSIIEKMQTALEAQEMEIVTLKEQLAIRSAEYARLAAQYDPFKLHETSSHSTVTAFSENRKSPSTIQSNEVPTVSKAELDLAMYMLHQRDMRCEEMTLEIVNLLAERDTLQLKLSNTLRQLEARNNQTACNATEGSSVTGGNQTATPNEDKTNTSSVAGSTVDIVNDDLNEKLSQLQTVSHSKDKIIKEEREQRIRQIEKLQQDVAKMPPAAVSELVGSDLSQTNQSPSTVLLNWLWGSKGNNNTSGGSQTGF